MFSYMEMSGRILAMSITHTCPLGIPLSKPLIAKLLGRDITIEMIDTYDRGKIVFIVFFN